MTVGEIVKNRREDLQMTQEELASRIGYRHKTSINKIESGKQKIMQDKILAFAKALQITPEQLMGWEPIVKSSLVNVPLSDAGISAIRNPFLTIFAYAVSQSISSAFATALTAQSPTLLPTGFGLYSWNISSTPEEILSNKKAAHDTVNGSISGLYQTAFRYLNKSSWFLSTIRFI